MEFTQDVKMEQVNPTVSKHLQILGHMLFRSFPHTLKVNLREPLDWRAV